MLIDKQNMYSQDQAVTASAASTNIIDHGVDWARVGSGEPLYLSIICTTTTVSAGATTVDFIFETSNDNSTWVEHFRPAVAVPKASLVAGYRVFGGAVPAIPKGRQYTRLTYTVNTADFSAGKFSAWLGHHPDDTHAYPSGYSI